MKNYKVLVYGRNFRMLFQKGRGKARLRVTGFFTTRFVRARDAQDAELRAMDLIRRDESLTGAVHNQAHDSPVMFAQEVVEVQRFKSAGSGYTFFTGRGAGRPRSFTRAKSSRRTAGGR